jgi:hypothetical protein
VLKVSRVLQVMMVREDYWERLAQQDKMAEKVQWVSRVCVDLMVFKAQQVLQEHKV